MSLARHPFNETINNGEGGTDVGSPKPWFLPPTPLLLTSKHQVTMNEKEIRAKYEAQVCATQMEFDRIMSEMNTEQTHLNHPYLDRERELARQKELLEQQKQAINIQLNAIKLERLDLEQKRKDINRVFHDLKHDLIMLNPRENYARPKDESDE